MPGRANFPIVMGCGCATILWLFFACSPETRPAGRTGSSLDRQYSAGNWWKYKTTTGSGQVCQITSKVDAASITAEGRLVTITTSASKPIVTDEYLLRDNWMFWKSHAYSGVSSLNHDFTPPMPLFTTDVRVKTWKWRGDWFPGLHQDHFWSFDGTEKVTVPAGVFECRKVTGLYARGGPIMSDELYFSPGVGLVKRVQSQSKNTITIELTDFSRN